MVAIFRFFILSVNSAGFTRATTRFCLPVTTALSQFSMSAFKKLSTKVEHSIGTWPTNMETSPDDCLYDNLVFRLFPVSKQINNMTSTNVCGNAYFIGHQKLQAKFVLFSLSLFIQITNFTSFCFWAVFNGMFKIMKNPMVNSEDFSVHRRIPCGKHFHANKLISLWYIQIMKIIFRCNAMVSSNIISISVSLSGWYKCCKLFFPCNAVVSSQ